MNTLEALEKWSSETPNKNVWTFLNDKGDITESYTYKVIQKQTSNISIYVYTFICDL